MRAFGRARLRWQRRVDPFPAAMRRLALVLLLAGITPAGVAAQASDSVSGLRMDAGARRRIIELALDTLSARYVFPRLADSAAEVVRAHERAGAYDTMTTGEALAKAVTKDLVAVTRDRHLGLGFSAADTPSRTGPSPPKRAAAPAPWYRRTLERRNFGLRKAEVLDGNVGYLDVRLLDDPQLAAPTVEAALGFVAHSDALILDLRQCAGGYPRTTALLASYLFDEPVELSQVHLRAGGRVEHFWTRARVPGARFGGTKPIYVVTSGRTFSACEGLAYDLQSRGRATVVGETTGGGANPGRPFPIGLGFVLFVPTGRAVSPVTGTNWEGVGVKPDVAAPAQSAVDRAHVLALGRLAASATDEARRHELEAAMGVLEKQLQDSAGTRVGP